MSTQSRPMTADELFLLPSDDMRHELVRGELTTMNPAGSRHGMLILNIAVLLRQHVGRNGAGVVFSADTGFVLTRDPDTVRAPDVSLVTRDRLPGGDVPISFFPGAPDLAVEVLSPSDSLREATSKAMEYLASGSREVWLVDSIRKCVTIHRGSNILIRHEDDSLDGGDLLPGFSCAVAELFVI